MTQSRVEPSTAAQKRQDVGLSPHRETAPANVARPPEPDSDPRWLQWMLVCLLAATLVVTALLAMVKLAGAPTDWLTVRAEIAEFFAPQPAQESSAAALVVQDEFESEPGLLVRDFQPNRWMMGVNADEGVYRIRMYPNVVAWSVLGLEGLENYRFSTSTTISTETPWGYGGVIGRYGDAENFFLVLLDGQGRYRVQVQQGSRWTTLVDWTAHPLIAAAGAANTLAVEDAGDVVRVVVNDEIVFQTRAIPLPPGDVGVLAGSLEQSVAQVDFDWIRLTALAEQP